MPRSHRTPFLAACAAASIFALGATAVLAADPVPAAPVAVGVAKDPAVVAAQDADDAAAQAGLIKSTAAARRAAQEKRQQSGNDVAASAGPRVSCQYPGCRKTPIIFGIYY